MNFSVLPSLLALAALVAVFWAIFRQSENERIKPWLLGWCLILLHFVAQFLDKSGTNLLAVTVSLGSLELAAVAFLLPVSTLAGSWRPIPTMMAVAISVLAYTELVLFEVQAHRVYYAVLVAAVLGLAVARWYLNRAITRAMVLTVIYATGVAALLAWLVHRGSADWGLNCILGALYLSLAPLYWSRWPRVEASAGVLTMSAGFLCWGAVFPTGLLLDVLAPSIHVQGEVWNIPKYFVAVGMILTLLEEQIARTRDLAHHDPLTGLPNRRLLQLRLEQAFAQSLRHNTKVAVFVFDLDGFKQVNDMYGHQVGDLALKAVAERLSHRIRSADTFARSGGDEFTVVSEVQEPSGADRLALDLGAAFDAPFEVNGRKLSIGASIGLALYPDDGRDTDHVRAVADTAMYDMKRMHLREIATAASD